MTGSDSDFAIVLGGDYQTAGLTELSGLPRGWFYASLGVRGIFPLVFTPRVVCLGTLFLVGLLYILVVAFPLNLVLVAGFSYFGAFVAPISSVSGISRKLD